MKHASSVVRHIQITEKGSALTEKRNQYFFVVDKKANKMEIKQAVEAIFNVSVAHVNTMRYMGKLKRERTSRYGRRPEWKRAVVTLKDGNKIELT
jgi:large subunit ribosomal protein L23